MYPPAPVLHHLLRAGVLLRVRIVVEGPAPARTVRDESGVGRVHVHDRLPARESVQHRALRVRARDHRTGEARQVVRRHQATLFDVDRPLQDLADPLRLQPPGQGTATAEQLQRQSEQDHPGMVEPHGARTRRRVPGAITLSTRATGCASNPPPRTDRARKRNRLPSPGLRSRAGVVRRWEASIVRPVPGPPRETAAAAPHPKVAPRTGRIPPARRPGGSCGPPREDPRSGAWRSGPLARSPCHARRGRRTREPRIPCPPTAMRPPTASSCVAESSTASPR